MFCPGHAIIDQVILRQHFDNPLRMRIEHQHLGEDASRGFDKELSVRREVIGEWKEALRDELSCRCGFITPGSFIRRHPVRAARIQRIQDNIFVRIEVFLDELARRIVNDDCFLWLSLGDVV